MSSTARQALTCCFAGGVLILGNETYKGLSLGATKLWPGLEQKLQKLPLERLRARAADELDNPVRIEQAEAEVYRTGGNIQKALIKLIGGLYRELAGYLHRPGPELVIVDEVHSLKDSATDLHSALTCVHTKRRIGAIVVPMGMHAPAVQCSA
jgi:hypothetical protein